MTVAVQWEEHLAAATTSADTWSPCPEQLSPEGERVWEDQEF